MNNLKEEKINETIQRIRENSAKAGYSSEEVEKLLKDYKDTNYLEDLYDRYQEKGSNITKFSEKYSKVVFIATNEVHNDESYDVEQVSITTFRGQLDKTYKNNVCIDRFYYSNKNKKNAKFTREQRKKLNATYSRTFEQDKKYIKKLIGSLNEKTLVVVFCKDRFAHGFDFLENENCEVIDFYEDLSHISSHVQTGLIPVLNLVKVKFNQEGFKHACYVNECLMKALYNIVYFYGLDDFKNKSKQKKNEINNESIELVIQSIDTKVKKKTILENLKHLFLTDETRVDLKTMIDNDEMMKAKTLLQLSKDKMA